MTTDWQYHERIYQLQAEVKRLRAENKKLKELAKLRDDLLVCYRIDNRPSDKLLDRLHILGEFEKTLKEGK